jgi:hypothetical protein
MHLAKISLERYGQVKQLLLISSILTLLNIGQICLEFSIKIYSSMEYGLIWMSFLIFAMVPVRLQKAKAFLISRMIYPIIQVKIWLKHQLFL